MFCPKCRLEYREGFTVCNDCGIPLVECLSSEPEPEPEPHGFVGILSTYNLADITFIKSILDDGDIEYFIHGENFNAIHPMVQPVRLLVREDQVDDAKELLKSADLNYMTFVVSPEDEENNNSQNETD